MSRYHRYDTKAIAVLSLARRKAIEARLQACRPGHLIGSLLQDSTIGLSPEQTRHVRRLSSTLRTILENADRRRQGPLPCEPREIFEELARTTRRV